VEEIKLDSLDVKLATNFPGRIVKKDLSRKLKGGTNVPTYVLEYLLGKYCASTDPKIVEEGLNYVKDTLYKHYCRPDENEKIKSFIKEKKTYRVIDKVKVRLVETENKYWAELTNLGIKYVNIDESDVRKYEKLLEGGIWAILDINYDEEIYYKKVNRPFVISRVKPIQSATIDIDDLKEKRKNFTRDEWLDIILRSIGMEPTNPDFDHRRKMLLISRLISMVENNFNFIELGPRGTGKSFVFREISPFAILLSGGKASVANLFMHMGTGRVGLVGYWDVIAFDEVAGIAFKDAYGVQIMKDYMELGSFSRGKEEIRAEASMVFNGNIDNVEEVIETSHLFTPFPPEMQDAALIDRYHFYLPGWEVPKLKEEYFTSHYGFITDYFSEILRELRKLNFMDVIDKYFKLGQHLNTRDAKAVRKTVSGLLKILHPDGNFTKDELEEYLVFAMEMRRRIKEQLKILNRQEYWAVDFSYIDNETKEEIRVETPELTRFKKRKIELGEPKVGRIYGLAYTGFGGSIIILEVVAMQGRAKLTMTGGLRTTIKESIRTAYDYLRANYEKYGIDRTYFPSHEIHFQAVEIAVPKEGPSAGITSATVLLSAAINRKIRSDVAMTGELTIHGEVLPVGGIIEKVNAAYENDIKTVIVPAKNKNDVEGLRREIKDRINFIFVNHIDEVFKEALI
jgi:ATP-dependent Lon protease